jgi:prepilin-type N-terminal cleavage/methylation domain-containing protein
MKNLISNPKKGFTLIEILVVIALIAILAAVTIVALNPGKAFQDARNSTRSSDVNAILNGVTQYTSEQGNTLAGLGVTAACTGTAQTIGTGTGEVNLATSLVPTYIASMPRDPSLAASSTSSGYTICITAGTRVRIAAPSAEGGKTIQVER